MVCTLLFLSILCTFPHQGATAVTLSLNITSHFDPLCLLLYPILPQPLSSSFPPPLKLLEQFGQSSFLVRGLYLATLPCQSLWAAMTQRRLNSRHQCVDASGVVCDQLCLLGTNLHVIGCGGFAKTLN